jgi:pantothenate kinase
MAAPEVLTDLEDVVRRATDLAARPGRSLLGITGPPGAGKSTLTELLMSRLNASGGHGPVGHLPMDGFHLADAQLVRLGRRDRKGAPDTFDVDGYVTALRRLVDQPEAALFAPGFERDLEEPIAAALVIEPSSSLVITEGNYLLHDQDGWEQVRPLLAEVWYVDLDPQLRLDRLIRRHERFGKSADSAREWVERSDETNARLVESTREAADLTIAIRHRPAG